MSCCWLSERGETPSDLGSFFLFFCLMTSFFLLYFFLSFFVFDQRHSGYPLFSLPSIMFFFVHTCLFASFFWVFFNNQWHGGGRSEVCLSVAISILPAERKEWITGVWCQREIPETDNWAYRAHETPWIRNASLFLFSLGSHLVSHPSVSSC